MGNSFTRGQSSTPEVDYANQNVYRYPPRTGCYFGSHFMMGGQRFETAQPEAYLFGDNHDLNWLPQRPYPFPYAGPCTHEATKSLKSLVNIRKDTLKLVKASENPSTTLPTEEREISTNGYNIEFTFDSDVRVGITIYYFATEEVTNGQAIYQSRDPTMTSEVFHYKKGANQQFSQATHIIDPRKYPEEDWQYCQDKELFPIVIQCNVDDEQDHIGHSHITFAYIEKVGDDFIIKQLKQKQVIDGLCYLLQEIFGIENKNSNEIKSDSDEIEDSGSECVICMSDIRDTLILPCRHLCLCNNCADSLRYQSSTCPICRVPFRALLQIKAMRKKIQAHSLHNPAEGDTESLFPDNGVPQGYEAVSLIEALNGPRVIGSPPPAARQNQQEGIPQVEDIENINIRKFKRRQSAKSNHSNKSNLEEETNIDANNSCNVERESIEKHSEVSLIKNHDKNTSGLGYVDEDNHLNSDIKNNLEMPNSELLNNIKKNAVNFSEEQSYEVSTNPSSIYVELNENERNACSSIIENIDHKPNVTDEDNSLKETSKLH